MLSKVSMCISSKVNDCFVKSFCCKVEIYSNMLHLDWNTGFEHKYVAPMLSQYTVGAVGKQIWIIEEETLPNIVQK